MKVFLLALTLAAAAPPAYAAKSPAAQFLNLGFGARALGMGEAFTAVADDASCVHYNPAGLADGDPGRYLAFAHAWHVQDTAVSQAAFMRRPYAVSLTYFSAGELEGRDALANPTGSFSARDAAFAVSRGVKFGRLQAGATAKAISQKIKSSGATSFAADLGVKYRLEAYSFGAALLNFGTKVKFEDESFPLPLKLKLGAAARLSQYFLAAADLELPNYGPAALRLGAEYRGLEGIALRLGYKTSSSAQKDAILGRDLGDTVGGVDGMFGFFAGVGFAYSGFALDYALLPYGDLGSAHRFSLGVKF